MKIGRRLLCGMVLIGVMASVCGDPASALSADQEIPVQAGLDPQEGQAGQESGELAKESEKQQEGTGQQAGGLEEGQDGGTESGMNGAGLESVSTGDSQWESTGAKDGEPENKGLEDIGTGDTWPGDRDTGSQIPDSEDTEGAVAGNGLSGEAGTESEIPGNTEVEEAGRESALPENGDIVKAGEPSAMEEITGLWWTECDFSEAGRENAGEGFEEFHGTLLLDICLELKEDGTYKLFLGQERLQESVKSWMDDLRDYHVEKLYNDYAQMGYGRAEADQMVKEAYAYESVKDQVWQYYQKKWEEMTVKLAMAGSICTGGEYVVEGNQIYLSTGSDGEDAYDILVLEGDTLIYGLPEEMETETGGLLSLFPMVMHRKAKTPLQATGY